MQVDHTEFFAKLEAKGEEAVRIDSAKGNVYAGTKANLVHEWLRKIDDGREAALLARSEARDSLSLSISQDANDIASRANSISLKALSNSRRSNSIAIIAAIIAAIAIIIGVLK